MEINFSPEINNKLKALPDLYREWNEKINVISRKDIDHVWEKHVLHSLAIHRFCPFTAGSEIMDLGTGGGFPGIPLAIVQPDVHFTLIDSIGKKIRVVKEIVAALDIKNVEAFHMRAEELKKKFDFVVTRAVAPVPDLVRWISGKIQKRQINAMPNGLIALKGGDLREELKGFRHAQVFDIDMPGEYFLEKKIVYLPL